MTARGPTQLTPTIFWMHDVPVTIPSGIWTPLPWNDRIVTGGDWPPHFASASTTIAAGSNGAVLPQGTINVVSTAAFTSEGYLVIRISGTDRVVRYTGKTATTFTGCTLGVGMMTTGDVVAQANVVWNYRENMLGPAIAEVAWASNAIGMRGTRFRTYDGVFNFNGGTDVKGAVASTDPLLRTVASEQPANVGAPTTPLLGQVIEAYQSSGGPLDSVRDGFAAPRLVATATSWFAL